MKEFLTLMKSNGAIFSQPADARAITLASTALQQMRAAVLPAFMIELFKNTGGIILGDAYIFGPTENKSGGKFPVPSIAQINNEISGIQKMRGFTVFGRNDLFWFAFDAFGACFMLDNISLRPLRKYESPVRALTDCLIVGKL